MTFLFVLLGVLELSLAETLVIGCTAALVQSLWKTKHRPEAVKVVFNVFSLTANGICVTYFVYHYAAGLLQRQHAPVAAGGWLYVLSDQYRATSPS